MKNATFDLEELAERCERSEYANRDLDDLIGIATGECKADDFWGPLAFTDSIDIATTIVPTGFAYGVGHGTDPDDHELTGWAWCGETEGVYRFAKSPALALCAAALRARAAIADTHPKDGDVKQAPLVSGGGAEGNRTKAPTPPPILRR